MRVIRSQEPRLKRAFGRDIIDIAALPGQEADIFTATGGLGLAEFHGGLFL
jgi:hypothetical protein